MRRLPWDVGKAKWGKKVNGARLKAGLAAKAIRLGADASNLKYAIYARDEVTHADEETITVTAADVFG